MPLALTDVIGAMGGCFKIDTNRCLWGARELGMTTIDLARKLNLAQPTVSQAVRRGQEIAEDQGIMSHKKI